MGINDYRDQGIPINLNPGLNNIKDTFISGYHSFYITMDDKVYSYGYNSYGELGLGFTSIREMQPTNLLFFNNYKVIYIATGEHHNFAITNTSQVFAFGDNKVHIFNSGLFKN